MRLWWRLRRHPGALAARRAAQPADDPRLLAGAAGRRLGAGAVAALPASTSLRAGRRGGTFVDASICRSSRSRRSATATSPRGGLPLRLLVPLEALLGFGLLTAAISWLLSVYPALSRRRSLAYELWLLREALGADGGLVQREGRSAEQLYGELLSRLVAVERDLVTLPLSYYFAERDERFSLPGVMPWLLELAERGRDGAAAHGLRARMLRAAIDDFACTTAQRFQRAGPERPPNCSPPMPRPPARGKLRRPRATQLPSGFRVGADGRGRRAIGCRQCATASRFSAASLRRPPSAASHYCRDCWRSMVCPIAWETDGEEHWLMELRCGECGAWREVRVTNAEAKEFDYTLGRHTTQIRRALARIDRERMEAELEVLVGALEHDLIDPADFAR